MTTWFGNDDDEDESDKKEQKGGPEAGEYSDEAKKESSLDNSQL